LFYTILFAHLDVAAKESQLLIATKITWNLPYHWIYHFGRCYLCCIKMAR